MEFGKPPEVFILRGAGVYAYSRSLRSHPWTVFQSEEDETDGNRTAFISGEPACFPRHSRGGGSSIERMINLYSLRTLPRRSAAFICYCPRPPRPSAVEIVLSS